MFLSHHFVLPDGSNYYEIFLPEFFQLSSSSHLIDVISQSPVSTIRLVSSSPEILSEISLVLSTHHFLVTPWETTFFSVSPAEINQLVASQPVFNTVSFLELFNCIPVSSSSDTLAESLLHFMLGSFASRFQKNELGQNEIIAIPEKESKINNQFNTSLQQPNQTSFLISNKQTGNHIGSFTVTKISEKNEIQLHSVAGFSSLVAEKTPNKLGVILAAVLYQVQLINPQAILTFSCSKPPVLEKYLSFNLPIHSNRFGLKIEKK